MAALFITLVFPLRVEAITRVNGNFFLNDDYGTGPNGSVNLFQGGVNLDIIPPTKKQLNARLNVRLDVTKTDDKTLWHVSPLGNLGLSLSGEGYVLNLQHSRTSTVSSQAQLTESSAFGAAATLLLPDLPVLNVNYTNVETTTGAVNTTSDILSFFSTYNYKWFNLRGGYSQQSSSTQSSIGATNSDSSVFLFGIGGSYEILPKTVLTGNYDFSRNLSSFSGGGTSEALANSVRLSAGYTPVQWLALDGNFSKSITSFSSVTAQVSSTDTQQVEGTVGLLPIPSLRLATTFGNRSFNTVGQSNDVTYATMGATFTKRLAERVGLALTASRSYEWDPVQGKNIADTYALNSLMDLTPRVSLRLNLGVSRNENKLFIETKGFDASGILTDRALYDDRPAGFTFFDAVNNNLYTKRTSAFGDWSPPVHFEPPTAAHFSVNKSIQMNMIPTDKTTLYLLYTASSASDRFDIGKIGSQSLNATVGYQPNIRAGYSLSGTATFPENGTASYAGTASMAYRFSSRQQMSINYGRQVTAVRSNDSVSGTLTLLLRKRAQLSIICAVSNLQQTDRTSFVSVRFSKSF